MKRNVLIFGSIAGAIPLLWFLIAITTLPNVAETENGMWYGYASMLIGNIFLVIGVKNYRDKHNGGYISFWKAFKVGILIALIAATLYVALWLIFFYSSSTGPAIIDRYMENMHNDLVASGASAQEIAKQDAEMKEFAVMYQNPFVNALFTYMEILPMGILFTLITALAMRKKDKRLTEDVPDTLVN